MITERGGFLVRRMHQIWSAQIQNRFREAGYDITSAQFAALDIILENDGLDQTDLALRTGYDRATVGGVIARLERAGYITRKPHPKDRRARVLKPTVRGRRAAAVLEEIAQDTDARLTAPLTGAEREALFASLKVLIEAGNALNVAPPFKADGRGDGAA